MQRYLRLTLIAVLIATLVFPPLAPAAIPSTAVWEVWSTGSNNNGGCFDSAKIGTGTDYSQQAAQQYTFSDLVIDGTTNTKVTSASHNFVTADVGNCLHITAGTGFTTGWFVINSVASNAATLDRSAGTLASTGGTYFVGGALATLVQLNTNLVSGNTAWVKATATYTLGAALTFNYSGGAGGTNLYSNITGYTTTRGDGGFVTVQYTASFAAYGLTINQQQLTLTNFIIDCNSQANTGGLNLNLEGARAVNVKVMNCTAGAQGGITLIGANAVCFNCATTAISGTGGAFLVPNNVSMFQCIFCVAVGNSVTGFQANNGSTAFGCYGCISGNNTGATTDCYSVDVSLGSSSLINNVAYNCGRDGFRLTGNQRGNWVFVNNISYGNAGSSINYTNGAFPIGIQVFNYNAYQAASTTNYRAGPNDIILVADPFTNGAANNFAINSSQGGGLTLRKLGFPGTPILGGTGQTTPGALPPGPGAVALGFTH